MKVGGFFNQAYRLKKGCSWWKLTVYLIIYAGQTEAVILFHCSRTTPSFVWHRLTSLRPTIGFVWRWYIPLRPVSWLYGLFLTCRAESQFNSQAVGVFVVTSVSIPVCRGGTKSRVIALPKCLSHLVKSGYSIPSLTHSIAYWVRVNMNRRFFFSFQPTT